MVYRMRRREKTVMEVAAQVDELFELARNEVAKNKKLVENAKKIVDNSHIAASLAADDSMFGGQPEFSSPEILSTIVSVLIQKFGTTRLNMDDFAALGVGEFVSVYVDQGTMEIILSMDQNLAGKASFDADIEDPLSSLFAKSPKDDTYH